ncbi:hypothetical protein GCM10028807_27950 [Spirosoma daeguense]
MINKVIYLPGINGLRAIAALSVVMGHTIVGAIMNFGLADDIGLPMSQFAVTLFFVISGFIITYLLLIEKQSNQVSIKKFYIRRVLRIWPLYYLFILICYSFSDLVSIHTNRIHSNHLYWYILQLADVPAILNLPIDILAHFWSLAVEEQFYLIWPWLFTINPKKYLPVIIIGISILLSLKFGSYFFLGKSSIAYISFSIIRFPSMMLGGLGAILYYRGNELFIDILSKESVQILAWSIFISIGFGIIYCPSLIAHELISLSSLTLIIGQVSTRNKLINLESNLLNFLGKISYGMYVIHPLCIFLLMPLLKELPINSLAKFLLGLILVFSSTTIFSYLSYQYFEKFFLQLKDKFSTVNSNATKPLEVSNQYVTR